MYKLCVCVRVFLAIRDTKSLNFFMIRLHAEINESFIKKNKTTPVLMMNYPLFQREDVSIANAYFSVRTVPLLKKEVLLEIEK